eukprot:RCo049005
MNYYAELIARDEDVARVSRLAQIKPVVDCHLRHRLIDDPKGELRRAIHQQEQDRETALLQERVTKMRPIASDPEELERFLRLRERLANNRRFARLPHLETMAKENERLARSIQQARTSYSTTQMSRDWVQTRRRMQRMSRHRGPRGAMPPPDPEVGGAAVPTVSVLPQLGPPQGFQRPA